MQYRERVIGESKESLTTGLHKLHLESQYCFADLGFCRASNAPKDR